MNIYLVKRNVIVLQEDKSDKEKKRKRKGKKKTETFYTAFFK
jgi:hypothetical protein